MKTWIYSWIIYPLVLSIYSIYGLCNAKVRRTLRLRTWKKYLSFRKSPGDPIPYWIHVASSGELEYAIPIIRELEKRKQRVLVTYYSISAQNAVESLTRNFANVCLVVPLPHDGLGYMDSFVTLLRNQGVQRLLLMKYELWPGLLWECQRKQIPVILVDALRPSWIQKKLLHKIFAIIAGYESELCAVSHPRKTVIGDTRVEQVWHRIQTQKQKNLDAFHLITQWKKKKDTLVAGSVWQEDEQLFVPVLRFLFESKKNVIWVPHETNLKMTKNFLHQMATIGWEIVEVSHWEDFLTQLRSNLLLAKPTFIVVRFKGYLTEIYQCCQSAYVGGAFGHGLHSVWEPALYGVNISCGPRRKRSPESYELESVNLLTQVATSQNLIQWIQDKMISRDSSSEDFMASIYVHSTPLNEVIKRHLGASVRIIDFIESISKICFDVGSPQNIELK